MKRRYLTTASFGRLCSLLGLLGGLALGPARLPAQQSLLEGAYSDIRQSTDSGATTNPGTLSGGGSPVSASYSGSFTGMDGSGNTRTMSFSGTASGSAQYGQLHASASGTVTNTYYNSANPAYVTYNPATGQQTINTAGSPDGFQSYSFASFQDTLQYGGALQSGYQARYIFHLEGTLSGVDAFPTLGVTIGNNQTQSFTTSQTGNLSLDWATTDVPIDGQTPQLITVSFSTSFSLDLSTGSTPDGSNVSGMAQFSDTLTLATIEVVDANGNPVSGVTITSDSGTSYPMAVPEPSTWAALLSGTGFLAFVLRRRPGTR